MTLSILDVSPDILGVRANPHLIHWPPSLPGLPKPVLFAEPSSVVAPGTNVTLGCSALQLTSQELLFTLSKAGSPGYPQPKKTGIEARFSLPSVKVRDAGSYSCFYSERRHAKGKSETSETLDLVVTGSLPRPSLQALPSAKVSLNGRVTLRCVLPVKPSLGSVMFMWLKAGTPEPLGRALQQSQRWANFTLPSVTVQDAGSFRCVYYEKTVQPRASEPSEPLYVCVTDSLTRPSLTVEPSSSVSLGEKMTLWCQSASCGTRFTLYKDGEDNPVQTIDSPQDKAGFLIAQVTHNHTGTYYCLHHTGEDIPTPALYSDPLELSVSGERDESFPEKGKSEGRE
ncbi:leukocyte immunoglobulin-like receptor subfamily A member 1 [Monodelphis domestica]|uniref:leukocyte immunoglobulin-like receptor subfamily A member 1 n=1 Tax=Monodelphis domestica TaxID=13616 RepID=UPI0024E2214B|nr:leukocyte immunoglobulin-like receptor subfamily A member 1 [Monodelphis domestica]